MLRLFSFAALVTSASFANAMAYCNAGDQEVRRDYRYEEQRCETAGFCFQYDWNPMTGRYEGWYGHHMNCPGVETANVETLVCENARTHVQYEVEDQFPSWSMCQVR